MSSVDVEIKAEVLVALVIRDSTSVEVFRPKEEEESKVEATERLYLWMVKDHKEERKEKTESKKTERLEKEVWDKVLDMLKRDTEHLMEVDELDVSTLSVKTSTVSSSISPDRMLGVNE